MFGFLDIGQGDAIIIQNTSKKTLLIDTGVALFDYKTGKIRTSMAERVVKPVLNFLGSSRIDMLFLSHMDMDHSGGVFLLSSMPVSLLIDNGRTHKKDCYTVMAKSKTHLNGHDIKKISIEDDLWIEFFYA